MLDVHQVRLYLSERLAEGPVDTPVAKGGEEESRGRHAASLYPVGRDSVVLTSQQRRRPGGTMEDRDLVSSALHLLGDGKGVLLCTAHEFGEELMHDVQDLHWACLARRV
jgi:hypothetical protein